MDHICSMEEIGGFLYDADYTDRVAGISRASSYLRSDLARHRKLGTLALIAATAPKQSFTAAALRKLGFRQSGTYAGHEGRIRVWFKALRKTR